MYVTIRWLLLRHVCEERVEPMIGVQYTNKLFPPETVTADTVLDIIYNQVKNAFNSGLTTANFSIVILYTIIVIDKVRNMTICQKKETIKTIISRMVDDILANHEAKIVIQYIIKQHLPGLIDSITSSTDNHFNTNWFMVSTPD